MVSAWDVNILLKFTFPPIFIFGFYYNSSNKNKPENFATHLCVLPALGPFKSIEVLSNKSLVGLSKKTNKKNFKSQFGGAAAF